MEFAKKKCYKGDLICCGLHYYMSRNGGQYKSATDLGIKRIQQISFRHFQSLNLRPPPIPKDFCTRFSRDLALRERKYNLMATSLLGTLVRDRPENRRPTLDPLHLRATCLDHAAIQRGLL